MAPNTSVNASLPKVTTQWKICRHSFGCIVCKCMPLCPMWHNKALMFLTHTPACTKVTNPQMEKSWKEFLRFPVHNEDNNIRRDGCTPWPYRTKRMVQVRSAAFARPQRLAKGGGMGKRIMHALRTSCHGGRTYRAPFWRAHLLKLIDWVKLMHGITCFVSKTWGWWLLWSVWNWSNILPLWFFT